MMNEALLLIDLQVDFLAQNGRMAVAQHQVPELLAATNAAYTEARRRGYAVAAIGNEFPRWNILVNLVQDFAALAGAPGAEWDARVPQGWDVYFPKHFPSAFTNPALDPWLKERDVIHLHLAGVMAGACVAATANAAMRRGYRVSLIEDGIAARTARARTSALQRLSRRGCGRSELAASTP